MNHDKPGLREELPGGHAACQLPKGRELTAGRAELGLSRSKAEPLTRQMGASSACCILLFCSQWWLSVLDGEQLDTASSCWCPSHCMAQRSVAVLPVKERHLGGSPCPAWAARWGWAGSGAGFSLPPALVVLAQQSHACKVRSESPGWSTVHFLTRFTCALPLTVLETRLAKVFCNAICKTAATDLGLPQRHLLWVQGSGRNLPTQANLSPSYLHKSWGARAAGARGLHSHSPVPALQKQSHAGSESSVRRLGLEAGSRSRSPSPWEDNYMPPINTQNRNVKPLPRVCC